MGDGPHLGRTLVGAQAILTITAATAAVPLLCGVITDWDRSFWGPGTLAGIPLLTVLPTPGPLIGGACGIQAVPVSLESSIFHNHGYQVLPHTTAPDLKPVFLHTLAV